MQPSKTLRSATLIAAGFLALNLLSGCAALVAVPPAASYDAPLDVKDDASLLLSTGDVLKITVYGDEEMTGEFPVNPEGSVRVPLAGSVKAAGVTSDQLEKDIIGKLEKGGFMKNAAVTVDVLTMRPYYVAGEVSKPDGYAYHPDMTAFQAVATAGGYTPRAARNKILIDRKQGDKTIRLNARENTPILPGDSIIIRERIF